MITKLHTKDIHRKKHCVNATCVKGSNLSLAIKLQVYVPQNIRKIYSLHKISKTRF